MNTEIHTLDSLRKLVRNLQAENKELRRLLDKAGIPCADSVVFSDAPDKAEEYDPDQGARISRQYIDRDMAVRFDFLRCFGEGRMYSLNGERMAVIIRSATIVGAACVRSKEVRSSIVRIVPAKIGQN